MLAYNTGLPQLQQAAQKVGTEIIEYRQAGGTGVRFRLGLAPDKKWRRKSASPFSQGRKVNAVCWHGHREFFRELFKLSPESRVQTAQTRRFAKGERFYTVDNFERVFEDTDVNIGSQMAPMYYSEACQHDHEGVWAY